MTLRERFDADRQVAIGAVVAVVLGLILVLGMGGAVTGLLGDEQAHTVRATFADSQQIEAGDDVRVDGVAAGKVERVALDASNRTTTVTMKVNDSVGSLYDNARAVLRFKTVLGGELYVDIERGTRNRARLRPGATLGVAQTDRQVEVDDITTAFQGGAQSGLKTLPGEFADAFRDHDAPAALLDTIADVSPGVDAGLNALRGESLDRDLQGLVKNTSRTVAAIDTPRNDVRTVISGAAATLQTTAARGDDIRSMLRSSPGTQRELDATLDRLRTTLDLTDPLLAKLQGPAVRVAPTFASLRPTLVDADALLQRSVPLLRSLRPAAASLARTAIRGLPIVRQLEPSFERLDKTILPSLSEVDAGTQRSTAVMIGGTFTGLASGAGGQMDSNGHFIRFPATVGSSPSNSLPCQIYFANPDAEQVAACNDLQSSLETYLNYNPVGETPGTEPPPSRRAQRRER